MKATETKLQDHIQSVTDRMVTGLQAQIRYNAPASPHRPKPRGRHHRDHYTMVCTHGDQAAGGLGDTAIQYKVEPQHYDLARHYVEFQDSYEQYQSHIFDYYHTGPCLELDMETHTLLFRYRNQLFDRMMAAGIFTCKYDYRSNWCLLESPSHVPAKWKKDIFRKITTEAAQ